MAMPIPSCDCYIIHKCYHVTIPFPSFNRLSAQLSSEDYSVLTSTLSPLVQNSDTEQVTNSGAKEPIPYHCTVVHVSIGLGGDGGCCSHSHTQDNTC